MKSLSETINEAYFEKGGNLLSEERELIKKFLGPYADKVKLKSSHKGQRFKNKIVSGFYYYDATDKEDAMKFAGYLFDLYKNLDDNLPKAAKGKWNYIQLKSHTNKEEFVKSKGKDYDWYRVYLQKTVDDEKAPEFMRKSAEEDLKKSDYRIYLSLGS